MEPGNSSLDFSQVSGFYGPGPWAAWLLAIISSFYSLCLRPGKATIPTILPQILYTNWAAIDLLRQVGADNLSFGSLTAAACITYWGLCQLLVLAIYMQVVHSDNAVRARLLNIRTLIRVGSIVPIIAVCASIFQAIARTYHHEGEVYEALGVVLVPGYMEDSWHSLKVYITPLAILMVPCFSYVFVRGGVFRLRRFGIRLQLYLGMFLSVGFFGFIFLWISLMLPIHMLCILWLHTTNLPTACFVKPCAPQSIKDWDQAFSLLCGLTFLLYEIGSDFLDMTKDRLDGVVEQFLSRRAI
jgi:hypothetical protein